MEKGARRHALTIALFLSSLLLVAWVPTASQAGGSGEQHKRVMFRDDDVAVHLYLNTLKAVNQIHIDERVPVTLGVIPCTLLANVSQSNSSNPLAAEEEPTQLGVIPYTLLTNVSLDDAGPMFIEYLRSLASSNLFELAQHGYDHRDHHKLYGVQVLSEFRGMPYDEQYVKIEEGRSLMQRAFGTAPTTFIPPFNIGDNATLKAVKALGFTEYSSCPADVTPTTRDGQVRAEPERITLPAAKWNESSTLQSLINQTEPLLRNPQVQDIVVVYHYRSFATDLNADTVNSTKLEVLRDYLRYLKSNDVTFATLNGTSPATNTFGSSSNATLQVAAPLQAARTQRVWTMLSIAAPAVVVIFLWNSRTRVK